MKTKSRFFKILIFASILLVAGLLAAGWWGSSQAGGAQAAAETAEVQAAELIDQVEASGVIQPQQSASLRWKTSGTVQDVLVAEGQVIAAGQALMQLDPASVPANVLSAQADLVNARKTLKDLETNAEISKVQALQKISDYAGAVKDAKYNLDNYTPPAEQAGMQPLEAFDLMRQRLDAAWEAFRPYENFSENDPTREDLKEKVDLAQSDYNSAVRRLELMYQLEAAEANLDKARSDYDRWKDGPDPDEVAAAEARIVTAEATLAQQTLTAPFAGEILALEYQPGDLADTTTIAASLADRSRQLVEVKIDESDISRVRVGSLASVTLDALPGETLTGKVEYINPLGATESGIVKYSVRVALDSTGLNVPLGATADVVIQEGPARQVLTVPIRAIQRDDNQGEYVLVVAPDGTQRRVDVVGGDLLGDRVVVTPPDPQAAWLEPGDLVVLNTVQKQQPRMGPFGG